MSNTGRRQRGGTLVEAALVLLLFLTLLLGIIEFARAFNIHQTATNAAREAARFAVAPCAFHATTCSYFSNPGTVPAYGDIQGRATTYLQSAGIVNPAPVIRVCNRFNTSDCSNFPDASNPNLTACDSTGAGIPKPACISVSGVDTFYTAVYVTAPYQPIFFKQFADASGVIPIRSEARMRDENQ